MPRFFLNIEYDDGSSLLDAEGGDYADESAAMNDARRGLKALVCETIDTDGDRVATHIHVVDAMGIDRGVVSIDSVVPPCINRALKS